ncbi:sterol 24-C-methyltransferase [Penicillium canescens]|nr:sterol 24-C-methyltransferase [Penicillium canescens]
MAPTTLEREDLARDAAFNKALHGNSAKAEGGLAAMHEYFKHWDKRDIADETDAIRESRRAEYATLTRQYTPTPLLIGDPFTDFVLATITLPRTSMSTDRAIARHKHFLALQIGIKKGMRVLDIGCGVGGPAREMIDRATNYTEMHGLSDKLSFVKGDFMQMKFPNNSFDTVYAIEATVHAPELEGVYKEIFRVLKPGGVFGVYEWLMTDNYDNNNSEHRRIRLSIEQGDGIANIVKISEGLAAF